MKYVQISIPGLSIEQQFELAKYRQDIDKAPQDLLQTALLDALTALMQKDNIIKQLMAEKLGIEFGEIHR